MIRRRRPFLTEGDPVHFEGSGDEFDGDILHAGDLHPGGNFQHQPVLAGGHFDSLAFLADGQADGGTLLAACAEDDLRGGRRAEIDIVEMFGNMGSANHNIHSQLTVKNPKHGQKNSFRVPLDVKKWHVYAIEWTPTYVTWTIDGKPVGTYKKSTDPKLLREGQWTFDQPCYIVLNQSVGDGSIKGIGRYRNTTYETQFDYIRIYQKVKR